MYDYELMSDMDELTIAFQYCQAIEISAGNLRLRKAALQLEENGVIKIIGKTKDDTGEVLIYSLLQ